ncbi:tigger transposable element-derived protein 6-like [Montipora capricornis]|uniref:tigger transposable element-derived protein 6-like n=1 Tax=Montipora capricornis TaxID=246305 RepID=UPI0035F11628
MQKSMVCSGNGIPEQEHQTSLSTAPCWSSKHEFLLRGLGCDTFQGTSGWLEKWKRRHNIGQMNIAGEEDNVSPQTIDSWSETVKELTKGYSPRDAWNEDETGCFWKAMLEKSLSQKEKRCRGGKNSKQRITAAFFVNTEDEKEGLIVIGSSKLPRCSTRLPNPSYHYSAQYFSVEKAWMRTKIMVTILIRLNNSLKKEERHVILFLDNAPCDPPSLTDMFCDIKVALLLKNTTSRRSGCGYDQGVEGLSQKEVSPAISSVKLTGSVLPAK